MKIKKLLVFLGILLVPFVAGATAYNDVTLTTNAVINVGSTVLNVSGSDAVIQSITVDASSFSFVLLSGSSIQVTSDGRALSTNADHKYIVLNSCNGSNYILKHSSNVDGSVNVTVTLDSYTCPSNTGNGSTGGSSSGNSSGGGGTSNVTLPPVVTSPPVTVTMTGPTGFVFTHSLGFGLQSNDVKMLQTRLLSEGFFKGEATGYFGLLTKAAVKAYQAKYGINQLGIVGPMTMAQLNKAVPNQLTSAQVSAIMSQINTLMQQVQVLQAKLKALSN